jgi:hypothetical protein
MVVTPAKAGVQKLTSDGSIDTLDSELSLETAPAFPVLPPSMAVAPE